MDLVYCYEMKGIGQRIEQVRLELGLSKSDIWKPTGLSSGVYSQWLNGTNLKGDNLLKVAKVLGVNPDWLQTGKGDKQLKIHADTNSYLLPVESTYQIPMLNVTASMGTGNEMQEHDIIVDVLRVSKSWVSKTLNNVTSIYNLSFIHAIGDSMHPTFNDGDILLVDGGIKTVTSDSVYVLEAHERLFIKRVRRRIDGTYEISSDNPAVKTVDTLNGDHQVIVKGRVVWVWNGKRV